MLIHDLTEKYGPVVREGRVTGVLAGAFDVVIVRSDLWHVCTADNQPEFGIEKRVHVAEKLPIENAVYDEHNDVLS
jgi:protein SSD1